MVFDAALVHRQLWCRAENCKAGDFYWLRCLLNEPEPAIVIAADMLCFDAEAGKCVWRGVTVTVTYRSGLNSPGENVTLSILPSFSPSFLYPYGLFIRVGNPSWLPLRGGATPWGRQSQRPTAIHTSTRHHSFHPSIQLSVHSLIHLQFNPLTPCNYLSVRPSKNKPSHLSTYQQIYRSI